MAVGSVDLAEVYNPGRLAEAAARHGLRPGFAVDLQTGWNMEQEEHVQAVRELQEAQDPFISWAHRPVQSSPACCTSVSTGEILRRWP